MENYSVPNSVREDVREIAEITAEAYPLIRKADELLMRLAESAAYTEMQDDLPVELREIYVAARRIEELSDTLHFELSNLQFDAAETLKEITVPAR